MSVAGTGAGHTLVIAARRTPVGAFRGRLQPLSAPELGAAAIAAVVGDSGLPSSAVDRVFMGCVLQAGLGQAPARQAALTAGLPDSIPCTTVNRVCGSGLEAIAIADDLLRAGSADIAIAGGMESMSNAPRLVFGGGTGHDNGQPVSHLLRDGLQNAYDGRHMGEFAERCAARYGFERSVQDAFATTSLERTRVAAAGRRFDAEICPVALPDTDGGQSIREDETPLHCRPERIPLLEPAFRDDGTITAASSATIADGAAAVLLAHADAVGRHGLTPLARVVARASYAGPPEQFPTAPVPAIRLLLERSGWRQNNVDLYEINEAFAVVVMAVMNELGLDHARVNVNGGACALGHPIGATGARLVVTLIHALRSRGLKRGIAALCIGGGEAEAIALEAA